MKRGLSLRGAFLGLCLACGCLMLAPMAQAAPKAKLIDAHWTGHNAASDRSIDHDAWTAILQRYIVPADRGLNRFAYDAVTAEDRAALDAYLGRLQDVTVTELARSEQKAYWINLYNAFTVAIILDNYPVDSITDIGGGLFSGGPWSDDDFTVTVEGRDLTLDNIEHGILRPNFEDPKIHYGVNCASVGCPNLRDRAYTGDTVDAMLAENARAFINSPRGIQNIDGKRVAVSSIYVWFKADFGGDDTGVIAHLKRYADGAHTKALEGVTRLGGHDYNWALNDASGG